MEWKKAYLSQLNIDDSCYIVISNQTREVKNILLPLGINKKRLTLVNGGSGSPLILEFNKEEIVLSWEVAKLIEVKVDATTL